jgi:hypothetical protein
MKIDLAALTGSVVATIVEVVRRDFPVEEGASPIPSTYLVTYEPDDDSGVIFASMEVSEARAAELGLLGLATQHTLTTQHCPALVLVLDTAEAALAADVLPVDADRAMVEQALDELRCYKGA